MDVVAQVEALLPRCTRTVEAFFDDACGYRPFQDVPRSSPVSHAMCIEALAGLPRSRDDVNARWEPEKHVDRMLAATLDRPKAMQAYDLSFVVPALRLYEPSTLEAQRADIEQVLGLTAETFNTWVEDVSSAAGAPDDPARRNPKAHNMFLYRMRRAVWSTKHHLGELQLVPAALSDKFTELEDSLDKLILDRFYYLVSMCNAVPGNDEDALQLGYALYSLRRYSTEIVNDVISEHAISLVASALVEEDRPPRLFNILRSGEASISATPIHLLAILAKLDLVSRRFAAVSDLYEKTYTWVRTTTRYGVIGDFHEGIPAWMQEPWRGVGRPEAWLNASVVEFLKNYAELLRTVVANDLTVEFGASVARPDLDWSQVINFRGIKEEIERGLISPIKSRPADSPDPLEMASVILFGPPGTAKTTLAKSLAWEVEWPFVEFKPHDFAMEGEDGVVRSISHIFRRLLMMRECVVFFDEIDELVTKRDDPNQTKSGRFITTSVLPWLQELRDRGRVVFIVATNNVELFDPAVKRPGRFDFVLPVGPPAPEDRKRLLGIFLRKALRWENESDIDQLVQAYSTSTLESASGSRVTLGELRQIAQAVSRNGAKTVDEALAIQAAVCEELAGHLLIDEESMAAFELHQSRYRFPPDMVAGSVVEDDGASS